MFKWKGECNGLFYISFLYYYYWDYSEADAELNKTGWLSLLLYFLLYKYILEFISYCLKNNLNIYKLNPVLFKMNVLIRMIKWRVILYYNDKYFMVISTFADSFLSKTILLLLLLLPKLNLLLHLVLHAVQ